METLPRLCRQRFHFRLPGKREATISQAKGGGFIEHDERPPIFRTGDRLRRAARGHLRRRPGKAAARERSADALDGASGIRCCVVCRGEERVLRAAGKRRPRRGKDHRHGSARRSHERGSPDGRQLEQRATKSRDEHEVVAWHDPPQVLDAETQRAEITLVCFSLTSSARAGTSRPGRRGTSRPARAHPATPLAVRAVRASSALNESPRRAVVGR